jgi:hypothetical protein
MPAKKIFSIVTTTRNSEDGIIAVDVKSDLDEDAARKTLAVNSDDQHQRLLFAGNPIPWAPSVSIGAPRKRKTSSAKPDDKPAKPKKPAASGTSFDINTGAKAPQGETHGT